MVNKQVGIQRDFVGPAYGGPATPLPQLMAKILSGRYQASWLSLVPVPYLAMVRGQVMWHTCCLASAQLSSRAQPYPATTPTTYQTCCSGTGLSSCALPLT